MKFYKRHIPSGLRSLAHFKGLKKLFTGSIGGNRYTVLYSEIGRYKHIRVNSGEDKIADWTDLQKIKDWLLGPNKIAIQVFPKARDLVDNGNTYHIFSWEGIEAPNLNELYEYRSDEDYGI